MNYLYGENIDGDDDNFDFRIYNDVAVDLESSSLVSQMHKIR